MNTSEKIKRRILIQSNSYRFYEEENKRLHEKNKELNKKNKELNKELNKKNKELRKKTSKTEKYKTYLDNDRKLIEFLMSDEKNYTKDIPNFCPICKKSVIFEPHGIVTRNRARCPECGSLERMRLTYLVFEKFLSEEFNKPCKLLHFVPEKAFYNTFKNKSNIDYYPVDFNPELYEKMKRPVRKNVNMENITYPDKTFDIVYTSHVLEHVPDDNKAMQELYRVLKDDGTCVIVVPLFNIPETLEKEEYNTPELRLKYYGQSDHLRKYGLDFEDKLKYIGFKVNEITTEDVIDNQLEFEVYKLKKDRVFICKK